MTEREKYIAGLREVADYFEANPQVDLYTFGRLFCSFPDSKDQFLRTCKTLGNFKKKWDDYHLSAVKTFIGGHEVHVMRDRKEFCTKVVTPVEVPATAEQNIEAYTVPARAAHTKEEVSWECPDDLSLIGEAK